MRYAWIDDFLMKKAGVTKLPPQWNWIRYAVGGKMFAAVCLGENNRPYYITLKLEPSEGSFLRQQYEDIIPGYYMNKQHWNSINPNGKVEDVVLCQDLVQVKMSFSHSNLPAIPKLPVDTILQNHRVTYNRNDYEFVWYYKTFPSIQIPGGMHDCNC